jgi:SAM-dependent methyltransferase
MNWNNFILPIMRYFRRKRVAVFIKKFPDLANLTVLDVGGRPFIWELIKQESGMTPKRLVLLNYSSESVNFAGYESIVGNGTSMDYPNKSFDLVFSNSVIEHVGDLENMRKFAAECVRVGRDIYIQTPNLWFPVEPHLVTLFIHWLPRKYYL